MDTENIYKRDFDTLGIVITTNEEKIKIAYEQQLKRGGTEKEIFDSNVAYQNCLVYVAGLKEEVIPDDQVSSSDFPENSN